MEYSEHLYKSTLLTSDISLKCCGRRRAALNHRFGPAARENCFLILLERGEGRLTVNKRSFDLRSGMLFVCFPGVVTSYEAEAGSVWDISWVGLNGDNIQPLLERAGIDTDSPAALPEHFEDMVKILSRIYELQADTVKNTVEAQGLVYSFFASLIPQGLALDGKEDYTSRAVRYMKHNIDREIDISEIADYVGLERVYFSKLFKKKTGLSPKDMLTKYRMEKAVYFMETTSLSVSEAARSVGYTDPLYFSRAFKRYFGVCPTEYIK